MIQQTSLQAYELLQPKLGAKQQEVLSALRVLKQATDKDLARFLGWPINTITPRRLELERAGLVRERGRVVQNGRTRIVWCLY